MHCRVKLKSVLKSAHTKMVEKFWKNYVHNLNDKLIDETTGSQYSEPDWQWWNHGKNDEQYHSMIRKALAFCSSMSSCIHVPCFLLFSEYSVHYCQYSVHYCQYSVHYCQCMQGPSTLTLPVHATFLYHYAMELYLNCRYMI
jgi:hypothetical protein